MAKTQRDHLYDTLQELGKSELKVFKDKLNNFQPKEGYNRIKWSELEEAETVDITRLLISYYEQEYALEVVRMVLGAMDKKNLVRSLYQATGGGQQQSYDQVQLEGSVGESVCFPALRPVAKDIVRIIWFSGRQGTHIAEAKPQAQVFNTNYLPYFSNRLAINTGNLSLEMQDLQLEDQGPYHAVVDIASDPTNPRTFSYELAVHGE